MDWNRDRARNPFDHPPLHFVAHAVMNEPGDTMCGERGETSENEADVTCFACLLTIVMRPERITSFVMPKMLAARAYSRSLELDTFPRGYEVLHKVIASMKKPKGRLQVAIHYGDGE